VQLQRNVTLQTVTLQTATQQHVVRKKRHVIKQELMVALWLQQKRLLKRNQQQLANLNAVQAKQKRNQQQQVKQKIVNQQIVNQRIAQAKQKQNQQQLAKQKIVNQQIAQAKAKSHLVAQCLVDGKPN